MKDQLKIGIILNYFTIGLNTLVGIVYTPFLLRMIGQSEYGLYSLVSSVIAYLSILDFGFGNAIIRYTAKLKAESKLVEQYKLFGMFLWLYLVIGFFALCFGFILYNNVDNLFEETLSIDECSKARIMILMLIFNLAITFPLSIFGAIIQAYEKFIFLRAINIVRIIVTTLVMVMLLKLGYKAIALVAVQTIMNIANLTLHFIYCKKVLKIKLIFGKIDYQFFKEISYYSLWIFIMAIVDNVFWNTGQFVLGAFVGTVAVAIYAVAIQLHSMHEQFSTAMSAIFLPRITGLVVKGDSKIEISNLFIKTGRIQYVVLSFVLVAFLMFGKQFIMLWAGPDYEMAYVITLLFFFPSTIPLIQNIGIIILQARNRMKFRALCYLFVSFFCLILQIVLVRFLGEVGCAVAISISIILGHFVCMNVYYYYKEGIDIPLFWQQILKMSVYPTIACVAGFVFQEIWPLDLSWRNLIFSAGLFSCAYLPLMYLFQLDSYEKTLVLKLVRSIKNSVIKCL